MRCSIRVASLLASLFFAGCSPSEGDIPNGSGASSTGAQSSGGSLNGSGGELPTETGGTFPNTGGSNTGGAASGGTPTLATGGFAASGSTGGTGGLMGSGGNEQLDAYDCNDPSTLKPTTFEMIRKCIIQPGCARSTCHDGEVPLLLIDTWEGFPRKEEHSAYDTLAETLLNHRVERCFDLPLVTPNSPEESSILMALSGTCNDPEDPDWIMPQGCRTVDRCAPPEYIELIADWIRAGAPMQ